MALTLHNLHPHEGLSRPRQHLFDVFQRALLAQTDLLVSLSGVALDNISVALVEVRVNGAAYQTATGTANWSQSVNLNVGNNLIEARSKDGTGSYSSVASITVNFVPPDIVERMSKSMPSR